MLLLLFFSSNSPALHQGAVPGAQATYCRGGRGEADCRTVGATHPVYAGAKADKRFGRIQERVQQHDRGRTVLR